jgi:hypothetical protein
MALKKNLLIEGPGVIQTPNGLVNFGPQKANVMAYCKVLNIFVTKNQGQVNVECTGENFKMICQIDVPLSVEENAPNCIKQAYQHIKTLPDWQGATDC